MKKLTREAQKEYQELKERIESLLKQAYLRGKIDALEGISINLDKGNK